MRALSLTVGLLAIATAAEADAMSFMSCLDNTVPINPSFVVEQFRMEKLVATTELGHRLRITTTPIGDHWYRVSVAAPAGTTFQLEMGHRCDHRLFRVSPTWTRPEPIQLGVQSWAQELWLEVELGGPEIALRVDWAYTMEDLRAGAFETSISPSNFVGGADPMSVPDERDLVFLRATPLLPDGSNGTPWTGWVHRDRTTAAVTFGQGPAPKVIHEPRTCSSERWVTGETPTFGYADVDRSFRAVTLDGRMLHIRAGRVDFSTNHVTVGARTGDVFRLEVMPPGTACPLEVEVRAGAVGPRTKVTSIGKVAHDSIVLGVDAGRTVVASTSSDVLTVVDGSVQVPVRVRDWTSSSASADLRVGLTPEQHGFLGTECKAVVRRDVSAGTAALVLPMQCNERARVAEPSLPPTTAAVPETKAPAGPTATLEATTRCSRRGGFELLVLLLPALGMWLAARYAMLRLR